MANSGSLSPSAPLASSASLHLTQRGRKSETTLGRSIKSTARRAWEKLSEFLKAQATEKLAVGSKVQDLKGLGQLHCKNAVRNNAYAHQRVGIPCKTALKACRFSLESRHQLF